MPNQPLNRSIIENMQPNELNARWNEVSAWMQTNANQPVKQWVDHGGELTREDLLQMSEEDVIRESNRVESALARMETAKCSNDK